MQAPRTIQGGSRSKASGGCHAIPGTIIQLLLIQVSSQLCVQLAYMAGLNMRTTNSSGVSCRMPESCVGQLPLDFLKQSCHTAAKCIPQQQQQQQQQQHRLPLQDALMPCLHNVSVAVSLKPTPTREPMGAPTNEHAHTPPRVRHAPDAW